MGCFLGTALGISTWVRLGTEAGEGTREKTGSGELCVELGAGLVIRLVTLHHCFQELMSSRNCLSRRSQVGPASTAHNVPVSLTKV